MNYILCDWQVGWVGFTWAWGAYTEKNYGRTGSPKYAGLSDAADSKIAQRQTVPCRNIKHEQGYCGREADIFLTTKNVDVVKGYSCCVWMVCHAVPVFVGLVVYYFIPC